MALLSTKSVLWAFISLISDMGIKMKEKFYFERIWLFRRIYTRKGIRIITAK